MSEIQTNNAPAAIGPYAQGVVCGDFLFTSGQCGICPADGQLVKGGIEVEAEQALINIGSILEAAGATYEAVVKTTCYLVNMADFAVFNAVYAKYFSNRRPARSCVAVRSLPSGALCEIEAVAYLK